MGTTFPTAPTAPKPANLNDLRDKFFVSGFFGRACRMFAMHGGLLCSLAKCCI
jgi:hypothetical protein